MSTVDSELRKAFDHVGLDGKLVHIGQEASDDGFILHRFSFWAPDAYTFQGPALAEQWRRVDEGLPTDCCEVLIWSPPKHTWSPSTEAHMAVFMESEFGWNGRTYHPTHWMPLPKGPSGPTDAPEPNFNSGWLRTSEVLPSDDDQEVLVWPRPKAETTVIYDGGDGFKGHGHRKRITHWMPLPEGPLD